MSGYVHGWLFMHWLELVYVVLALGVFGVAFLLGLTGYGVYTLVDGWRRRERDRAVESAETVDLTSDIAELEAVGA